MYLPTSQGAQNYKVHNILLNLLLTADLHVPENLIFQSLLRTLTTAIQIIGATRKRKQEQ